MDQHPNDIISEYLHEPFMMMFAGFFLYFLVMWKRGRNKGKWNGKGYKTFWMDQKDEMAVAFIAGLMFVVWDSQILGALDFVLKYFNLRDAEADPIIMQTFYYFLVAPAVETISRIIDKLTSKNGNT